MLDDFDSSICNGKHHGPALYIQGDYVVMRCSFCEQLINTPISSLEDKGTKRKSSRTCVSACDWVTEDKIVRCRSCSYTGQISDCQTTSLEVDT